MLATCICLNGSLLDQLSCTIVYLHNLFTCTFGRINMSVCLSVCLESLTDGTEDQPYHILAILTSTSTVTRVSF